MSRRGWHTRWEEGVLTLARRWPPRFDVAARTVLPTCRPLRLAHQIRQDIWRALQHQRGFAPVVEITPRDGALSVRAGGQVDGRVSRAHAEQTLVAVLSDADRRNRWIRHAGGAA